MADPVPSSLTLRGLAAAAGVCAAWYAIPLLGFFGYAAVRGGDLLALGLLGLLPAAFVGFLISLVVLGGVVKQVRSRALAGTISAWVGLLISLFWFTLVLTTRP
ncbi:MAG TPA: hypothetical protein VES42_28685 [Pilimelia sp.]|nr:hypothetical protein [Pilimelia sp.]